MLPTLAASALAGLVLVALAGIEPDIGLAWLAIGVHQAKRTDVEKHCKSDSLLQRDTARQGVQA